MQGERSPAVAANGVRRAGDASLDPNAGERGMERLVGLLANELNVKEVSFLSSADASFRSRQSRIQVARKEVRQANATRASAVAALTSEALLAFEKGEPLAISVGNDAKQLDADDLTIVRRASGKLVVKEEGGYFAAIDATVTPELRTEGLVGKS